MLLLIKRLRWLITLLVLLFASQAFGHGMSEEEKQMIVEGGNLRYILIGATHMLSGYDHLLFVFGIIFFLTRFKDIVKYITAFTIGHSITLIWATFNAVQINYFLIDAVIALSVCYIAFQNLDGFKRYFNIQPPNMLVMIFSLGLIHGLGLSTRLQQLPLSEDNLLMNIISFNIGIEVGQILALAAMLVLMTAFRKMKSFSTVSKLANSFLVIAGCLLFFSQMHGYQHTANAEEFAITAGPAAETSLALKAEPVEWKETMTITLPAGGDKEYKLDFEKGKTLQYSWYTDKGELFFDFHGEPKDDTSGYFKTFKKGTEREIGGTLKTEFAGTHGWYWRNNNSFPVVITLNLSGEYSRLSLTGQQKSAEEGLNKRTRETL